MNYSRRGESNEKAAQRENALFIGFKGDLHELEGEKKSATGRGGENNGLVQIKISIINRITIRLLSKHNTTRYKSLNSLSGF